jgi:hypothetical protein
MSTSTAPHSPHGELRNAAFHYSNTGAEEYHVAKCSANSVLTSTKYDTSAFYLWRRAGSISTLKHCWQINRLPPCHSTSMPIIMLHWMQPRSLLGSMRAGRHAMSSQFSSRPPYQLHCGSHVVVPRTHWRTCRPPCLLWSSFDIFPQASSLQTYTAPLENQPVSSVDSSSYKYFVLHEKLWLQISVRLWEGWGAWPCSMLSSTNS